MKVSFDLKKDNFRNNKKVSFEGYQFSKSDDGYREFQVAYPFDPNRHDCYLEVYRLGQDQYGNYYTTGRAYSRSQGEKYKLNPHSNKIDLASEFGIQDNEAFAYHYLLVRNDGGRDVPHVRVDAGDIIDERSRENEDRHLFNVVSANKSSLSRGGSMKLVIIDSQKVGYVYNRQNKIDFDSKLAKRGVDGIKTLTNKFGGTLAGLEKAVEDGEYDAYGRIISLPIFTDDDFSAHAYWNKNCMQMASSLGNINNYASLQRKMFAHGLNFVSDGAFVNEGLQGVHFKHVLRWGEESPYFNWFRASSLKDGPLSMGVFAKNKDYISHKIVNSPYTYKQSPKGSISIKDNSSYDPKKPTYIQFFDTRLVSEKERFDTTSLIKTYSKMSTTNVYDLHTHNDSIYPYAFEINPETYNRNIKNLDKYNDKNPNSIIDLKGPMAAKLLSKFENFVVDGKFESGFETWDANPDIAKLNFVYSNTDTLALKNLSPEDRKDAMNQILYGNVQVQDYAVTSGQYWTQKTDDILRLHVAQNLKYVDVDNPRKVYAHIQNLSNGKVFPKTLKAEVSLAEVENVLDGVYNHKRTLSNEDKRSQIIEGLMNTPLDTFEFGDNLVSVLASPMLSKRAAKQSEIGVSRYELYKAGNPNLPAKYARTYNQMDKIYTKEMYNFADSVLTKVDKTLPADRKLFEGENLTEYGKYVIPLLTPEIAKYAVIKSLAPEIEVAIDTFSGEISYDYKALKDVSLQTIGITNPSCPEDETQMVLDSLRKGLKKLDTSANSEMVESIVRTLKDTNLASFQLADLIIDKNQAGLDWRIDATKDIADVEALRNNHNTFDYTWRVVTSFWKKFTQGVISKNPNAYTVAEITDAANLHDNGFGYKSGKYPNKKDIVPKFLRDTGMTSKANYSYFFNDISKLFTKNFEDGSYFSISEDEMKDNPHKLDKIIYNKMVSNDNPFIRAGSLDSLLYSYTFIGNHDKPRALHCAAMDMSLFYTDLTYEDNHENRKKAYQIIHDKFLEPISDVDVRQYDFSSVSPKAIAMVDAIRPAFIDVLNDYRRRYGYSDEVFNTAFEAISKSLSDLAQGKFLGKRFDPEAFGIKPIDVSVAMVLKQATQMHGLRIPGLEADTYENDVFEAVMKPAMSKLLGIMKYLVALPGMPTLFDGDDIGATGYDTKTKNVYLQGRQRIHDEWITEGSGKYKDFIRKYKEHFNDAMKVRKDPRCNALNNGAIFTLPLNRSQEGHLVPSILRQSPDGRMALSIFNPTGLHYNHRASYVQDNIYVDKIYMNENFSKNEGVKGLKVGTIFRNAKDENDIYKVNKDDKDNYYITRIYNDKEVPIPLHDTTLILYHVPNATALTFTGSNLYTPNARLVSQAYSNKVEVLGDKLALVSK